MATTTEPPHSSFSPSPLRGKQQGNDSNAVNVNVSGEEDDPLGLARLRDRHAAVHSTVGETDDRAMRALMDAMNRLNPKVSPTPESAGGASPEEEADAEERQGTEEKDAPGNSEQQPPSFPTAAIAAQRADEEMKAYIRSIVGRRSGGGGGGVGVAYSSAGVNGFSSSRSGAGDDDLDDKDPVAKALREARRSAEMYRIRTAGIAGIPTSPSMASSNAIAGADAVLSSSAAGGFGGGDNGYAALKAKDGDDSASQVLRAAGSDINAVSDDLGVELSLAPAGQSRASAALKYLSRVPATHPQRHHRPPPSPSRRGEERLAGGGGSGTGGRQWHNLSPKAADEGSAPALELVAPPMAAYEKPHLPPSQLPTPQRPHFDVAAAKDKEKEKTVGDVKEPRRRDSGGHQEVAPLSPPATKRMTQPGVPAVVVTTTNTAETSATTQTRNATPDAIEQDVDGNTTALQTSGAQQERASSSPALSPSAFRSPQLHHHHTVTPVTADDVAALAFPHLSPNDDHERSIPSHEPYNEGDHNSHDGQPHQRKEGGETDGEIAFPTHTVIADAQSGMESLTASHRSSTSSVSTYDPSKHVHDDDDAVNLGDLDDEVLMARIEEIWKNPSEKVEEKEDKSNNAAAKEGEEQSCEKEENEEKEWNDIAAAALNSGRAGTERYLVKADEVARQTKDEAARTPRKMDMVGSMPQQHKGVQQDRLQFPDQDSVGGVGSVDIGGESAAVLADLASAERQYPAGSALREEKIAAEKARAAMANAAAALLSVKREEKKSPRRRPLAEAVGYQQASESLANAMGAHDAGNFTEKGDFDVEIENGVEVGTTGLDRGKKTVNHSGSVSPRAGSVSPRMWITRGPSAMSGDSGDGGDRYAPLETHGSPVSEQ